MKLQMFGTVGRATLPADTGRHGGRPYVITRLHEVKSEPQNRRISIFESRSVVSLLAGVAGFAKSARSFFFKIDRIHYFDIRHSLFDIRYSLFHSFFFELIGHTVDP
jgi:hypothetical protein